MIDWLPEINIDWNSQNGGIIIGALIGSVSSIAGGAMTLFFQGRRMKKQLDHDLIIRREQFEHEREQEIRGRRTEALAELQQLLESQFTALGSLWAGYRENSSLLRGNIRINEHFSTLVRREYRQKLWPVNTELTRAINIFAEACHKLREMILQGQLIELEPFFQTASDGLSAAIHELPKLMSRINEIRIIDD